MVEPRRRRLDFARARSRSSCPLPRLTLPLVAAWPKISDAIAGEAPCTAAQPVRGTAGCGARFGQTSGACVRGYQKRPPHERRVCGGSARRPGLAVGVGGGRRR